MGCSFIRDSTVLLACFLLLLVYMLTFFFPFFFFSRLNLWRTCPRPSAARFAVLSSESESGTKAKPWDKSKTMGQKLNKWNSTTEMVSWFQFHDVCRFGHFNVESNQLLRHFWDIFDCITQSIFISLSNIVTLLEYFKLYDSPHQPPVGWWRLWHC